VVGVFSVSQAIFKTVLAIGIALVCLVAAADLFAAEQSNVGVVKVEALNLRAEPGADKPAITKLNRGDKVVILGSQNGWLKVVCGGQIGYILDQPEFLTVIKGAEKAKDDASAMQTMTLEAGTVKKNIQQGESKVAALAKKEATLVNGLNEIDFVLTTVRKKMEELQSLITALDAQMNETAQSIQKKKQDIDEYKKYAGRRLVALYKLQKLGGMAHILISADSMHDLFVRKTGFEKVLAYDEKMLIGYARDVSGLKTLFALQKEQKNKKHLLEDEFKNQLRVAEKEKEKQGQLLSYIHGQKLMQSSFLDSLKQAAEALDQKIKSFETSTETPRKADAKSFADLKGLLNLPVKGKVVSFFGPYTDARYHVANFRSGIDIRTDRGEPIRAVSGGKVLFSEWFNGFGNMMIIDHGDHYYTVYANIDEFFKSTGAPVEAGEVIATAGDSGSLAGPKLYFEIRYHGKPLNPLDWIKRG
jgi:murein hydrolase activator